MTIRKFTLVFAFLMLPLAAGADELLMKNGSRLVGKLVSASESSVVFETPFAGEITIKQENIEVIVTDNPVTVLLQDGRVYRDRTILQQDQELLVMAENQQPVEFNVPDIKLVNPEPWQLGDGYKWFGQANAALESERGNTDSDEWDTDMESIWRSLRDRYTIRGVMEIDKSNGDKTKNTWTLRNKYDRFSSEDPDNYSGVQLFMKHDEFADLDLRTGVGPYIGRQFFQSELLTLHAEVGVVYVDEQFDVAEDDDYWGSNWEMRLTSGIIPKTELYVFQVGVFNFDETDNVIINTTIGISFPLLYGFKASAEALYEYDGGAVEDVDDTDETYRFKLGYTW